MRQLLEVFEALPDKEKRISTAEFPRRAIPVDSGPLDDEETATRPNVFSPYSIPKRENDTGLR